MAAVAAAISLNTAFKQNPLSVSSTTHQFLGGFSKRFNFDQKFGSRKRDSIGLAAASAADGSSIRSGGGRFYFNVPGFPFPLGPFLNRRTIRTEELDRMWKWHFIINVLELVSYRCCSFCSKSTTRMYHQRIIISICREWSSNEDPQQREGSP